MLPWMKGEVLESHDNLSRKGTKHLFFFLLKQLWGPWVAKHVLTTDFVWFLLIIILSLTTMEKAEIQQQEECNQG